MTPAWTPSWGERFGGGEPPRGPSARQSDVQTQARASRQAAASPRLHEQVKASENDHRFRLGNCLPREGGAGLGAPCGEHAPVHGCSGPRTVSQSGW